MKPAGTDIAGFDMKLFAFRSAFDGEYFVESGIETQDKRGSYDLRVPEGEPGQGRPFYLLIVSPGPAATATRSRRRCRSAGCAGR